MIDKYDTSWLELNFMWLFVLVIQQLQPQTLQILSKPSWCTQKQKTTLALNSMCVSMRTNMCYNFRIRVYFIILLSIESIKMPFGSMFSFLNQVISLPTHLERLAIDRFTQWDEGICFCSCHCDAEGHTTLWQFTHTYKRGGDWKHNVIYWNVAGFIKGAWYGDATQLGF